MNNSGYICRSCSSNCSFGYIDLETPFQDSSLLDRFNYCTKLHATSNDDLPNYICVPCCKSLQTAYDFIKLAYITDQKLRANFQAKTNLQPEVKLEIGQTELIEELNTVYDTELDDLITEAYSPLKEEEIEYNEPTINDELIAANAEPNLNCAIKFECQEVTSIPALKESEAIEDNKFCLEEPQVDFNLDIHQDTFQKIVPKETKLRKLLPKVPTTDIKVDPLCKEEFTSLVTHIKTNYSDLLRVDKVTSLPKPSKERSLHICELCQKSFRKKSSLRLHTSKCGQPKVEQPQKPFECNRCTKTVRHSHKNNVLKHLCSYCPKRFYNIKAVEEHETFTHGNEEKPFQCHLCESKFITSKNLRVHLSNVHVVGRPFKCAQCPKTFKNNMHLRAHTKLHTKKDISCEHCDKKFVQKCDLKIHMRSHTGEMPFECHLCDKKYSYRSALTYHLQRHMGLKHRCPHCSEEFEVRSQFRLHMFTHIGMPYTCDQCGLGFPKRIKLFRHSKRLHKIVLSGEQLQENRNKNERKLNRNIECKSVLVKPEKEEVDVEA